MFINEIIDKLNSPRLCPSFDYPVFYGYGNFTVSTSYMDVWRIMIKGINVYENALYDKN